VNCCRRDPEFTAPASWHQAIWNEKAVASYRTPQDRSHSLTHRKRALVSDQTILLALFAFFAVPPQSQTAGLLREKRGLPG
jgi:hypothetical protein